MGRGLATMLVTGVLLCAGLASKATGAQGPPSAWNGANPFNCVLQQAGFGSAVPDPGADPYCVEFDKRRQNVTQLGVVDFLSKEPARVAAATGKCFYFQSDHWRGSIVQGDAGTKTYEWDGHYFFDKARGEGGVWVTNFNFNGQTYDPSSLPGMPQQYAKFFGPGTGGVITHNEVDADPACAERARREADRIYSPAGRPAGSPRCLAASGSIGARHIGPIALGATEGHVRDRLGAPTRVKRGFLRYCLAGGGSYLVGTTSDRTGETGSDPLPRAVMLVTSGVTQRVRGVGPGAGVKALRRAFRGVRVRLRIKTTSFYSATPHGRALFAVRGGRVRWVAVYDARRIHTAAALRSFLLRSRGL